MKQTFVQNFHSGNIDKPITRESIAKALTRMVKQLEDREEFDPDQSYWPIKSEHTFEIEGCGTTYKGQIRLTINL